MYSGTTIRTKSGRVLGVHQKVDRVARRFLVKHIPPKRFPTINSILHFEGINGPDGIKRKSPGVDEPWHFINPEDPNDRELVRMILEHRHNLITALRSNDDVRAAYEASWIAHAITDGLTPAHHYPLSDKIEELWGKPKENRISVRDKNVIIGHGKRDTVRKNWQYWGAKGVWPTHFLFEWGVASAISTMRFVEYAPDKDWLDAKREDGLERVFLAAVERVYELDMYHTYWQKGWNRTLASQTRTELLPIIIRLVTFAWYDAVQEAYSE